ncbi:hypothetical protein CEXT_527581 [Caerostris extrusa]|uniref:Uncharacterized protein n=1 Tax=Caerostris extrusa TaxID=172846 RepID=A0AAV4RVN4_CAEEX|nr:hypothetical protein CEXT_527581 [Caerostris extrusa]
MEARPPRILTIVLQNEGPECYCRLMIMSAPALHNPLRERHSFCNFNSPFAFPIHPLKHSPFCSGGPHKLLFTDWRKECKYHWKRLYQMEVQREG